ncbi:MAG: VCBS repeat-containing protein [Candidatus Thermoplasmatota archaeon]|nr:VCBS repeat-containing protein [Candidatus Thermoplasmatota archaeon]
MIKKNNVEKNLGIILVMLLLVSGVTGSVAISREDADTLPFVSETDIFDSGPGELINPLVEKTASLAVIDYDGDGDLDYVEGRSIAIFIATNNDGQFEKKLIHMFDEPDPDSGYWENLNWGAIAVADLNNNGQQDLIVGGVQGRVRLFINNNSQPGEPRFDKSSIVKFGQTAWGIGVADFNDDGWMDFAVSHATSPWNYSTITMFYNNGDLTFTQEDIYHQEVTYIKDLAAGDFTGNGHIDLIYTRNGADIRGGWHINVIGRYYLLENNGDDTFGSEKLIAERGRNLSFYLGIGFYMRVQRHIRSFLLGLERINPQLAVADFNGDGSLDFVVGDNNGMIELFLNDGQGDFVSEGVIHRYGQYSWGLTAGDFNEDGYPDLLVGALERYEDESSEYVWLKYNQLGLSDTITPSDTGMSDTFDAVSDFLFPSSSWLIHGNPRVMDKGLFRQRDCYDELG